MKNKILLISGSNLNRTPFVGFYLNILDSSRVNYDVLYWNRDVNDKIDVAKGNEIVYDIPLFIYSNPLKKIYATYKFYKFGKKIIKRGNYDKVICFTILTSIFFQQYLTRRFKKKYIFDIRDHSPLISKSFFWTLFEKMIHNSYVTVISSRGFFKWLPQNSHYLLSHNIDSSLLSHNPCRATNNKGIEILTIGFFVRFEPNGYLIQTLGNVEGVKLSFVGYGPRYKEYEDYCKSNHIQNVEFKGRYQKEEELNYYDQCNMVNILLPHTLNSDTCMSNRFYNAVVARKPMIVNSGCYQAELVEKYKLGLVVDNYDNAGQQIIDYYQHLKWGEYFAGCEKFIEDVMQDNKAFENKVKEFVKL